MGYRQWYRVQVLSHRLTARGEKGAVVFTVVVRSGEVL